MDALHRLCGRTLSAAVTALAFFVCAALVSLAGTPTAGRPGLAHAEATRLVVTSPADSGPSTLRWAVSVVRSGESFAFDPAVFPPGAPVTNYLTSSLPPISQGNLIQDANHVGVIWGRVCGCWAGVTVGLPRGRKN